MKVREFLTEANWAKGDLIFATGKQCIVTAAHHCYGRDYHRVLDRIDAIVGSAQNWNDDPTTTWPMVKELIEKADI